jgi:hypothetical protein
VHNLEDQTQNVSCRSQEEEPQRCLEIVVSVAVQRVFLVFVSRHPQNVSQNVGIAVLPRQLDF